VTDTPTGDGQVRPLAAVLQDLRRGAVLDQASTELQALTRAVVDTGKKGRLVLTIEVGPMKGNPDALVVAATVKTTPPVESNEAVYFADSSSNLVRDDPKQPPLPGLREVGSPAHHTMKEVAQ
jgi:hypothetical protein